MFFFCCGSYCWKLNQCSMTEYSVHHWVSFICSELGEDNSDCDTHCPFLSQLAWIGGLWCCHGYTGSFHLWRHHNQLHLSRHQQLRGTFLFFQSMSCPHYWRRGGGEFSPVLLFWTTGSYGEASHDTHFKKKKKKNKSRPLWDVTSLLRSGLKPHSLLLSQGVVGDTTHQCRVTSDTLPFIFCDI